MCGSSIMVSDSLYCADLQKCSQEEKELGAND